MIIRTPPPNMMFWNRNGELMQFCELSAAERAAIVGDAKPRKRRPNLEAQVKRAIAAGLDVRSAKQTSDGVLLTFGEIESPTPLDVSEIETPEQLRRLI
jgi:hypothetical protein